MAKNVRRKVDQDGLLLYNYKYRSSADFPSPVGLEKWLNPVPFGTDPMQFDGPHPIHPAPEIASIKLDRNDNLFFDVTN